MPINVIHFEHKGCAQWGVVRDGKITAVPGSLDSTRDFVRAIDYGTAAELSGPTLDEKEVKLLSPVTRDVQFLCLGANYRQHMIDSGVNPDEKSYNMIFTKAPSCIVPADHEVIRPHQVRLLDYEIELGLVLKRDITGPVQVTDENLGEFIAGVVIVNDYSARDVQIPQTQFYKGKSFRTFGTVGPYLCLLSTDDMRTLKNLDLRLTVNGQLRQSDNTSNMVYSPAETLTELSGVQDLFAGDLISTGTPSGCALGGISPAKQKMGAILPEKKKWELFIQVQKKRTQYLVPGDVVEARIASPDGQIDLGTQHNTIIAEALNENQ